MPVSIISVEIGAVIDDKLTKMTEVSMANEYNNVFLILENDFVSGNEVTNKWDFMKNKW